MNGLRRRHRFTTTLALGAAIALGCSACARVALAQSTDLPAQGAEGVMTPADCRERLEAQHVRFAFTPPVAEGACAIPLPVRLQSLAVGADDIRFTAEPTLDCRLAERLARRGRQVGGT